MVYPVMDFLLSVFFPLVSLLFVVYFRLFSLIYPITYIAFILFSNEQFFLLFSLLTNMPFLSSSILFTKPTTYQLTRPSTNPFIHSLSFIHLPTHPSIQSPISPVTHPFTHLPMHLPTHQPIHLSIQPLAHPPTRSPRPPSEEKDRKGRQRNRKGEKRQARARPQPPAPNPMPPRRPEVKGPAPVSFKMQMRFVSSDAPGEWHGGSSSRHIFSYTEINKPASPFLPGCLSAASVPRTRCVNSRNKVLHNGASGACLSVTDGNSR